MKNELFLKIKEDLPTLPTVVTHLLNLILDDRSSVKDISKIISIDQTLTSKVLRVVNSAAYGLQGKISSLEHALTILGLDTLKNLFLSISIFDNLLEKDQSGKSQIGNLNKSHLWCHSLAVATVARSIARFMNYKKPDEAYVAGLLHDLGKVIIEQSVPAQYRSYLENLHVNPTLSLQSEEEYLHVNHALVGKIVFERWNFPVSLQKAIEFHHGVKSTSETISDLAAIISAADFICWTQALGSFDLPSQPMLDPQVEEIVNFKDLDIEPVLEEMKRELEINSKIFNFHLNNPEELRKALQRANLELGRINSLYEETKKKQARQIHELSALNTIVFKTRKVLDPSRVMKSILEEIHEGFSFARLIWFSVDVVKGMIIPQGVCGIFQSNLPIITTGCNLDEEIGSPFLTCIQSRNIVHLDSRKCAEKTPDFYLLKTMQSQEMILIPISSGEGVADLLLLDNPQRDVFISSDTIQFLDLLAMNLGMALEN
ncbi:MAG: HDOD domain-containing protein, partial [bacterium]